MYRYIKNMAIKKIRLYTQYPSGKTILVKKYSLNRTNVLLLKLLDNRIY